MADINSVILVGRLVKDSELTYLQNGQPISRFSIAVNRAKRSADGKWEDEPNYFDCVYFGKAAEGVSQYLEKGRQVAIQGELRQSRWKASDGQTRSRVEVSVNNLTLCQSSSSQGREPSFTQAASNTAQQARENNYSRPQENSYSSAPVGGPEDFQDDSIPF